MSTPERVAFTGLWRGICDLIDADPDVPLPQARAHFVIDADPGAPQIMEMIATALGAGYDAQLVPRVWREWLELSADKAGTAVSITAHAAEVCTRDADPTGLGWHVLPAIAALLAPPAEPDEAQPELPAAAGDGEPE